jgi:hypothetical protein
MVGMSVYVPFWVIQEYLDISPPDAFVKCEILKLYRRVADSPTGHVAYDACDLKIKQDLTAFAIPQDYIIILDNLVEWANKIADWFKTYPSRIHAT